MEPVIIFSQNVALTHANIEAVVEERSRTVVYMKSGRCIHFLDGAGVIDRIFDENDANMTYIEGRPPVSPPEYPPIMTSSMTKRK